VATAGERDQCVQEPLAQAQAPCFGADANLPDEHRGRVCRRTIGRNETEELPVALCDDAGISEVAAEQQVGVARVGLEDARLLDQLPDAGTIGACRCAQCQGRGVVGVGGGAHDPPSMLEDDTSRVAPNVVSVGRCGTCWRAAHEGPLACRWVSKMEAWTASTSSSPTTLSST